MTAAPAIVGAAYAHFVTTFAPNQFYLAATFPTLRGDRTPGSLRTHSAEPESAVRTLDRVSIGRAFGDSDPVGRQGKIQDLRPDTGTGVIGVGTLACPDCDAPTAPGPIALGPTDGLRCPICAHAAPVRDFLSLAVPSRPARVVVRLRARRPLH